MKQLFSSLLFGFAVCLSFSFCGSQPTQNQPSATENQPNSTLAKPAAASQTFRGMYSEGDENRTFYDCATSKTYWVEDATNSLSHIYLEKTAPIHFDNELSVATVRGSLKGKSTTGHAALCDDVLLIEKVDSVEGLSREKSCFETEFWLSGTEPFWDMQISKGTQRIDFQDIGMEKAFSFPYVAGIQKGNSWIYESENTAGEKLRILIKKEPASDGMSDKKYDYSSLVVIGKNKWKGVARKGK